MHAAQSQVRHLQHPPFLTMYRKLRWALRFICTLRIPNTQRIIATTTRPLTPTVSFHGKAFPSRLLLGRCDPYSVFVSVFACILIQSFWFCREGFGICAAAPVSPAMQTVPLTAGYCQPYQLHRQVKGRPRCEYTKWTCPRGWHMCQLCGRAGHGSEDCRTNPTPAP